MIPSATGTSDIQSAAAGRGMVSVGRPDGIDPTVATPWSASDSAAVAAVAGATAMSAPGALGTHRRRARIVATLRRP